MRSAVIARGTDARKSGDPPLYVAVATDIEQQVHQGTLKIGDRVPSVRQIKAEWQVSTSTALQALIWLERRGIVESRPRSGFYVRVPYEDLVPEPSFEPRRSPHQEPGLDVVLEQLLRASRDFTQLGAAVPAIDFFPVHRLNSITREIIRANPSHSCGYEFPPGTLQLRRQIAKRTAARQIYKPCPEQLAITSGAMEGLILALRAVARPGDAIAVESPTYFGILQMIQSVGMKVVEIPTDPRTGIDIDRIETSIAKERIRACIITSNCHNPLGCVLSDERKQELAELAKRRKLPIIEDDVYGDLAFQEPRPHTIKFYDREGFVTLVSSFSKVLGPGYRVGWISGGRWHTRIEQLQFVNTIAAPSMPQLVIGRFLESGAYARHLRRITTSLANHVQVMSRAIAIHFPSGTRLTRPGGGFLLWVQMPPCVDSMAVYREALNHHVTVVPGPMFSTLGRFGNCLRMSCGMPWSDDVEKSVALIGNLARQQC